MATIDFETRCKLDLRKVGPYVYARHCEVICLSYKIGEEPTKLWKPILGHPVPKELIDLAESDEPIHAHNAAFERLVWNYSRSMLGLPTLPISRFRCTAVQAAVFGLPRLLDECGAALKLPVEKDWEGRRIMLQLCKPRRPTVDDLNSWYEPDVYPDKFERVFQYCIRDTDTEVCLSESLPQLTPEEQELYELNERINDRGIPIDRHSVENAIRMLQEHKDSLNPILWDLTSGFVESATQVGALVTWLRANGLPDLENCRAETLSALADRDDLPEDTQRVLAIRRELSLSSTAKYQAMLNRLDTDDRIRGTHVHHGAHTGRPTGVGVQFHNMPKGFIKGSKKENRANQAAACNLIEHGDLDSLRMVFDSPPTAISWSIRSMVKARPNHRLIVVDYAGIENRFTCWIAGEQELLQAFEDGADPYKLLAMKIYGIDDIEDVTDAQRFTGKTAELGLEYAMGPKRFRDTLIGYGQPDPGLEFCQDVVKVYRGSHSAITAYWYAVADAFRDCIDTGKPQLVATQAGNVSFELHKRWLTLTLPSGRDLHYMSPEMKWAPQRMYFETEKEMYARAKWLRDQSFARNVNTVGLTEDGFAVRFMSRQIRYYGRDQTTGKWKRQATHGGKITENIVQAGSGDIHRYGMRKVDAAGYRIILHVYDEIVAEVANGFGSVDEMSQLMCELEPWAKGCPIKAEGFESERYRK